MNDLMQLSGFEHEETRWGRFCSLLHGIRNGKHTKVKLLEIEAGKNISYQMHYDRSEIWHISKGAGTFVMNGRFETIMQGDMVKIPKGAWHSLKAGDGVGIEIIEIQYGDRTEEDDIARLYFDWNDIVKYVKEV